MKWIVFVVVVFSTILVNQHIAGQPLRSPLARIEVSGEADVWRLIESGMRVYENLGTWVIAEIGKEEVELLEKSGFNYQILDIGMLPPGDYYLVISMDGADFLKVKPYAKILSQEGRVAIVKATQKSAGHISSLGYEIKRINRNPIALPKAQEFRPTPLDTALIREMTEMVSENHVRWYIQDLQDFGSRYSYAPGDSLAAEYIRQELDWLGLETEFHSYEIPYPMPIYDVHTPDGKEAWRVDEGGNIWHTSDGGANWNVQYTDSSAIPLFGCYFTDSLTGWVCGAGGIILHTSNGGLNWTQQTTGGADYFFRMDFVDNLNGWAAGGDSGRVASTTDGGTTWNVQSGLTDLDLYGVSFVDLNRGWVAGQGSSSSIRGVILNTTDGGSVWTVQKEDSTHYLLGIDFVDSANGWAVGVTTGSWQAYILHTTDGGSTWTPQSASGWYLFDVDFVDANTGWASGFRNVLRTIDGGSTWITQNPGTSQMLYGIDFSNPDSGWTAGSDAALFRSTNGGTSWNAQWVPVDTISWLNPVGTLPGVIFPDSVVIVCGHIDCISDDPYFDAPGADDNASGTSLFMEAASILSRYQFERTIKFIGFSGEEQGLLGSEAYAQEVGVNLNIVGVLNFDMIGYLDDANWDLNIRYNSFSQWLADVLYQAALQYTQLAAVRVFDTTPNSDHASFWNIGASAICGIERAASHWNPYYHTTADRIETLTLPFASEVTKLGVAGAATIAVPFVVGVEEIVESGRRTQETRLLQNTPNPFAQLTTICYQLKAPSHTTMNVYDITGRLMATLVNAEKDAGFYTVTWDRRDDLGRDVSNGVYFYRLQIPQTPFTKGGKGDFTQTRKMIVLR